MWSTEWNRDGLRILRTTQDDLRRENGDASLFGSVSPYIQLDLRQLVLLFDNVRYVDSSALMSVVRLHEVLRKDNKSIQLYGVKSAQCEELIELAGLDRVVPITRVSHPLIAD